MFDKTTFNNHHDDSAPATLANGAVHLPNHPNQREIFAAADWILMMARNPQVCAPKEIEAQAERRREAEARWEAADDVVVAIESALPAELSRPSVVIGEGAEAVVAYDDNEISIYVMRRATASMEAKRAELLDVIQRRQAALAAAGYNAAKARADGLLEDMDAIEREFVRLVPTTLATLLIFATLAENCPRHVDERDIQFRSRMVEGLKIMIARGAGGN